MSRDLRNKIKFKRYRVVLTCIYAILSVAAYSSCAFVSPDRRYLRQLTVLIGTILAVIALISFFKLFTYEIRRELYRRISQALFNAEEKWRNLKARIRKILGLPERSELGGKDERSIIFDDSSRKARKERKIPRIKYSDLTDNRSRLRFLWAKYVITKAVKDDPPIASDTCREIEFKLPDEDGKEELFNVYRGARYAQNDSEIPDVEVMKFAGFVGTSGKI